MQLTETQRHYWQRTLRITGILLAIWFFVTFVIGWFARDLNFNLFGWPFSFCVGGQGAINPGSGSPRTPVKDSRTLN